MSAQRPDSPNLRPNNPFDRHMANAVSSAKPRMCVDLCERPLPGGTSLTSLHRRTRGSGSAAPIDLRLWVKKFATNQFWVTDGQVDMQNVRWGSGTGPDLDNDSPVVVTTTDARFWLALEYDLTFEEGWFVSGTLSTAYVTYGSTVPTNDLGAGKLYVELGRVVAGVITRNFAGYNLYSLLRDNSSLSSSQVVYALGRVQY